MKNESGSVQYARKAAHSRKVEKEKSNSHSFANNMLSDLKRSETKTYGHGVPYENYASRAKK